MTEVSDAKPSLPPKPLHKPGKVRVFRALYKYDAQYHDELSFKEGDLLYVIDQSTSPDWWKARCGNKTGLIPSNYVESNIEEVQEPLHEAARRGNYTFLQEYLSQGVSVTSLDSMGNTAIHWASRCGHSDCLQLLLSQPNPPINAKNHFGDTALHVSVARGHIEVVQILLKHGADTAINNNAGDIAEDIAPNPAIKNIIQLHSRKTGDQLAASIAGEYGDEDSDD